MLSDEELKIIEENLKNMNEKEYRQYLFGLALQLGRGGQKYVVDKFHISHNTLKKS